MPSKPLPSSPSLDHLKYQAKDLLNSFEAANAVAVARIREFHPKFSGISRGSIRSIKFTLSEAQLVIAREYGFESWAKLKRHIESLAPFAKNAPVNEKKVGERSHADRVAQFLEYACPDHHIRGGFAHIMARNAAVRLLRQHPEIARESIHTAVVSGELEEVRRILAERPQAATEKFSSSGPDRSGAGGSEDVFKENGPKLWEPLLFLCFTRLPIAGVSENAVAIARLLLDHGANPNSYFMAGDSRYTPLVGVIGEGEENRPPHPQRDEMVKLLLECGANPYDVQVIYNTHFRGEVLWFLQFAYERCVASGRKADWDHPDWPMFDMGGYGSGARFLLNVALQKNDLILAEWMLSHGANPNAAPPRAKNLSHRSLYEGAVANGLDDMARLLARHGAETGGVAPVPSNPFYTACFRLDHDAARSLAREQPEYLLDPAPLMAAAEADRADVAALLLDLGMSPDLHDARQGDQQALHVAAFSDSSKVAALLLGRGAEVDFRESNYGASPLSFAIYSESAKAIEVICRYSRDVWNLAFMGELERLREVLALQPELAKAAYPDGETPLMRLCDDESTALEIVKLLLSCGADPAAHTRSGTTAADFARKRELNEVAAFLDAAAASGASAISQPDSSRNSVERLESLSRDWVAAFETGDATAIQRLNEHYRRSFDRDDVRADIWRNVYKVRQSKGRPGCFTLADAQWFMAREAGYGNWEAFMDAVAADTAPPEAFEFDERENTASPRRTMTDTDWDHFIAIMRERRIGGLEANGQMTDGVLKRIAELEHVTRLNLGGSRQLSDDGLLHLARMPQLQHLDLSEYPGGKLTDRGLAVLRHLPALRSFQMCWQSGISDAGMANLAFCDQLEVVNLLGSPTGDGAIRALRGKKKLHSFKTGRLVTNEGLALLHEFPVFKTWAGGAVEYELLSADAKPNHLLIDGPFTDEGLAHLNGLNGLFGLSFFWHVSAMTPDALGALASLPKLGFLGCEGKLCNDTAMRHIAAIPRLRMLMAQGTVASDDGFEALSQSRTIENIWGRECPNLTGRGFAALSRMPSLRGLAMSCKQVDDDALALLPRFPALRELTPIEVTDPGFRHIGRCENLEQLTCMYCRETTDAATEQISGLTRLKSYYAGLTKITDRSLKILGGLTSLERIEFYECQGISDTGLAFLARLPRLKEIHLTGQPNVTLAGTKVFPAGVRVKYSA